MTQAVPFWPATPLLVAVLAMATWTDVRRREVPAWLSLGAIVGGFIVGLILGRGAPGAAFFGLVVGVVPLSPLVALGAFGGADLLLLAAIGTWEGSAFVVRVIWWMAMTGAVFAVIAWRRGSRTFPYVPAIALGTLAAIAFPLLPL
jgi:Flp pilus assembly protein protease CpaA